MEGAEGPAGKTLTAPHLFWALIQFAAFLTEQKYDSRLAVTCRHINLRMTAGPLIPPLSSRGINMMSQERKYEPPSGDDVSYRLKCNF